MTGLFKSLLEWLFPVTGDEIRSAPQRKSRLKWDVGDILLCSECERPCLKVVKPVYDCSPFLTSSFEGINHALPRNVKPRCWDCGGEIFLMNRLPNVALTANGFKG